MKKYLLVYLQTGLLNFTISSQNSNTDREKDSLNIDPNNLITQLKEQLKTQLKEQLETQLITGFDSLSNKELNIAIDSMVLVLDGVIEQSKGVSMDSLEIAYSLLSDFNFKLNDQGMDEDRKST